MDFKVRCTENNSSYGNQYFTVGKIYPVKDGCFESNERKRYNAGAVPCNSFEEVEKITKGKYEFELVPDRPHICEVLGNGKPLEVNEEFRLPNYDSKFRINAVGHREMYYPLEESWSQCGNESDLSEMINHPEKIIRQPQFSEDEKALMRLYVGAGYPWIARDSANYNNQLIGYAYKPDKFKECFDCGSSKQFGIPNEFLSQITFENSPFDAASYLEAQK